MIAIENSTFGIINEKKHQWGGHVGKIEGFAAAAPKSAESWKDPFNDLYIRTWRDLARYRGSEALGQEGPPALMRLPWLMEEILDAWDVARKRPQFKAEYMITHNIVGALGAGGARRGRAAEDDAGETEKLVAHYLGYTRPLAGDGVKPVPPFLFVISKDSRDHCPEVYREVIIPMFAGDDARAARRTCTRFGRGRAHLHQARARPAGRHRAGGGAVLPRRHHGRLLRGRRKRKSMVPIDARRSNGPTARKSAPRSRSRSRRSRAAGISRRPRAWKSISCRSRHANYGGNAGIWRILEVLERNKARATVDVNGLAVQKWPDAVKALHDAGNEIAGHGTTNDIQMTDLSPRAAARGNPRGQPHRQGRDRRAAGRLGQPRRPSHPRDARHPRRRGLHLVRRPVRRRPALRGRGRRQAHGDRAQALVLQRLARLERRRLVERDGVPAVQGRLRLRAARRRCAASPAASTRWCMPSSAGGPTWRTPSRR